MSHFSRKLGVVVVSYQSEECIQTCLRSVFFQEKNAQVVVVDNASTDKSTALVREYFPSVHLLQNAENLGFSKAVNQGIRYLIEKGCEDILLLNPDTKMEPESLDQLRQVLHQDPDRGVVQGLLTIMDQPKSINSWGNEYRGFGIVTVGGYRREITPAVADKPIQYASGACMLIKKEVLEQVGYFDEGYFLYFEDTEFSERVRRAGYSLWLASGARIRHDYSPRIEPKRVFYWLKGWWRYYRSRQVV